MKKRAPGLSRVFFGDEILPFKMWGFFLNHDIRIPIWGEAADFEKSTPETKMNESFHP